MYQEWDCGCWRDGSKMRKCSYCKKLEKDDKKKIAAFIDQLKKEVK